MPNFDPQFDLPRALSGAKKKTKEALDVRYYFCNNSNTQIKKVIIYAESF